MRYYRRAVVVLPMFLLAAMGAFAQATPETKPEESAPLVLPGNLAPPPENLLGPKNGRPMKLSLPPPDQNPGISNYFRHLKKLMADEAAKPIPQIKRTDVNLTAPRDYPFDALDGLTSQDLMRAVKEGQKDARTTLYGRPQPEIDRLAEANMRFVLEYYPLIAHDADAMNNLIYIMENPHADPVFRRILFTASLPGHYTDTLFSRFLQDGLRQDSDRILRMYGKIILDDQDTATIRRLTIENMYAWRTAEIAAVLAKDPNAIAFADANNRPPSVKDLMPPPAFTTSPVTKTPLKKMIGTFGNFATLIGDFLKPTSSATAELRAGIIEVLKRMKSEVPLEDPALIDKLLSEAAPAGPVAVGAPDAAPPKKDTEDLAF